MARSLSVIMQDIRDDYASKGKPVHPWAVQYVDALATCDTPDDMYIAESARSMIPYLLGNLQTWRGDVARSVKAELKAML